MAGKRQPVPPASATKIFLKSKRRCALCFGLNSDLGEKDGQIAHLDRKSSNNTPDNLAYLCLPHHDKYDSKPSQTRRLTATEVKHYRAALYEYLKNPQGSLAPSEVTARKASRIKPLDLPTYQRKLRIYEAVKKLLNQLTGNGEIDVAKIQQFLRDTDEALFMFEKPVLKFLSELHKKAVRFYVVGKRLGSSRNPPDRSDLIEEDCKLLKEFSEAYDKARDVFRKELKL